MLVGAFIVPHPPLIIPAVGRGQEDGIPKTVESYEQIAAKIRELKPETVVITTPHSIMYRDYIHISPGSEASGSFAQFGAPQVNFHIAYDQELAEQISDFSEEDRISAGFLGEQDPELDHAFMSPLYLIRDLIGSTKFVRIGLSGMSAETHYRFGEEITKASDQLGRRIVLIASGDLSHVLKKDGPYGYRPEGPEFDSELVSIIKRDKLPELLDFDEGFCDRAAECGLRSFIIMAGALNGLKYKTRFLSYEGPYGVGYACAEFIPDQS